MKRIGRTASAVIAADHGNKSEFSHSSRYAILYQYQVTIMIPRYIGIECNEVLIIDTPTVIDDDNDGIWCFYVIIKLVIIACMGIFSRISMIIRDEMELLM